MVREILIVVVYFANCKHLSYERFICVYLLANYWIPKEIGPALMWLVGDDNFSTLGEEGSLTLYRLPSVVGDIEDTLGAVE